MHACRLVVDLGSGGTGLCAFSALESCALYVYLCASLELVHSIQAQIRPSSHLFVCERLRFATTADMFAPSTRAATMLQQRPTVFIVRIGIDPCCSYTVAGMRCIAAAALVPGSLLVFIDGTPHLPDEGSDLKCREDSNGLQWVLMHKGRQFRVLKLAA